MSDNPNGGVPPKLDLKKAGVLRDSTPGDVSGVQIKPPQAAQADPPTVKIQPRPVVSAQPAATAVPSKPLAPSTAVPSKPSAPSTGAARPTLKPAGSAGVPKLSPAAQKPASVVTTPPAIAQPGDEKRQTSKIPLDVALAAAKEKKKETSRIALESAAQNDQGISKAPTGKLAKPSLTASAGQPAKPIELKPTVPGVAAPATVKLSKQPGDEKRQTSRISLEAALTPPDQGATLGADAGAPKTIKLKRPSEAPTIKASPRVSSSTIIKEVVSPSEKIGATQRVEVQEEELDTPTKRKTIKVKRPSARPTVKGGMTIKKSAAPKEGAGSSPDTEAPDEGAAASVPAVMGASGPVKKDTPHVAFHIVAVFAIIVACVTIYMFCAQVIGPNACLTQYSYNSNGPNLGWMNKMSAGY